MQGYCSFCKQIKEMQDVEEIKLKNGRPAYKGRCPTCDRNIYKLKKDV